jgi:hypothetical protein
MSWEVNILKLRVLFHHCMLGKKLHEWKLGETV